MPNKLSTKFSTLLYAASHSPTTSPPHPRPAPPISAIPSPINITPFPPTTTHDQTPSSPDPKSRGLPASLPHSVRWQPTAQMEMANATRTPQVRSSDFSTSRLWITKFQIQALDRHYGSGAKSNQ